MKLEQLHKSIAKARADALEAQAIREKLLAKLVDSKADSKVIDEVGSIDTEIADANRRLRTFEDAQRVAEIRDSESGRKAAREQMLAARKRVDELGIEMDATLRALIEAIERLHPLVERYAGLGTDRASAAYAVLRHCGDTRTYDAIASTLRGDVGGVRASLADSLYSSGIGRVAVMLHGLVDVTPGRAGLPLEAILAKMNHRVSSTLDRAIAKHEAVQEVV